MLLLVGLWVSGAAGGDDEKLERARLELGDVFNLRRTLSGEAAFPHRYRSQLEAGRPCCAGAACTECQTEQLENLQATGLTLRREIRVLELLGCPCAIASITPQLGPAAGGTQIFMAVSGMDLTMAFGFGPVECWFSREVEQYVKTRAVLLPGGGVRCDAPEMARLPETSLSLHSANFTLSAGHASFRYVCRALTHQITT